MSAYANVHIALEQMRVRALSKARGSPLPPGEDADPKLCEAPRVLILGPENAGKTTVAKILTNYAVRGGQIWTPLLANVDPSEGAWAIPGTLSVTPVSTAIPTYSPASPLGFAATSAPLVSASHQHVPLAYWYGHSDTKRNPLLLDRLIRNLGENINDKFDLNPEAKAAGIIVDTPASFASNSTPAEHRQKLIKACVDAFRKTMAPSSALPVGAARAVSEMQPVRVNAASPGSGLLNAVLAVLAPPNPDENERYDEEILDLTVTGFIYMWVDTLSAGMGAAEG
ncbi:hypothetical protein H1R20_g2179, partial [Candolleomyces eurysporus]